MAWEEREVHAGDEDTDLGRGYARLCMQGLNQTSVSASRATGQLLPRCAAKKKYFLQSTGVNAVRNVMETCADPKSS